jgi:putative thioredoxin
VIDAFEALDRGEIKRALDLLVEAIGESDGNRDDLRRAVVGVLDELGVDDPLAREYRRRLATALY